MKFITFIKNNRYILSVFTFMLVVLISAGLVFSKQLKNIDIEKRLQQLESQLK